MDNAGTLLRNAFEVTPSLLWIAALVVVVAGVAFTAWRRERKEAARRNREAEARLGELVRSQAEMQGRLANMADMLSARQAELNQSVNQRLDGMTPRIGNTLRSDEHTSELHSLMRNTYAVFCLKKKK